MLISTVSCKKELDSINYISYFNNPDNGLKELFGCNGWSGEANLKTPEYCALQELAFAQHKSDSVYQSFLSKYNHSIYFTLKLTGLNNADSMPDQATNTISSAVTSEYLNFNMQQDLKLVNGADTLDCTLYHNEPYNSQLTMNTILLGFATVIKKQNLSLIYVGNIENLKCLSITFEEKHLTEIPYLKL